MTVYSSSTSLILTDLLTRGQNYSFAVAVTDSTGQYGPWSDQLMVTYDGMYIINPRPEGYGSRLTLGRRVTVVVLSFYLSIYLSICQPRYREQRSLLRAN